MQKAGVEQFARDEGHAASGVEIVHVGRAVRIDAGEQRRDAGDIGEIIPVDEDTGGLRHRRNVQGVVGGAARGHQADDGVDDGFHIDDLGHDRLARLCELDATQRGGADEGFAQGRAGIDEGGAGQMEAHQLHHHLVGVGGAVEGAGACGVVGGGFSFEQLVARDLAECEELTDFRFFLVVDAGGHGAGWRENHGQVAEG